MGIIKKIWFSFLTITLMAMFLPSGIVLSAFPPATVEINNGVAINLDAGQVILSSQNGATGIPLAVKNLPPFTGTNGFSAFTYTVTWDPSVINVTDARGSADALLSSVSISIGSPDNVNGRLLIAGFTQADAVTTDMVLVYIGLKAVGAPASSCQLSVNITDMQDANLAQIDPRVSVPAVVTINEPPVESITVSPAAVTVPATTTVQFSATANYLGGGTKDVTNTTVWTSSLPATVSIQSSGDTNPGLATASAVGGPVTITAAYGGQTGTAQMTVTPPTTVEINNGNEIVLSPGQVVASSQNGASGIPLSVKNLPAFTGTNGFSAFTYTITWDPSVVNVTDARGSADALLASVSISIGTPDNVNGRLLIAGFTQGDAVTTDMVLAYIGVSAVGAPASSCLMDVTITDMQDATLAQITPRVSVPATVQIGIPVLQSITVAPATASVAAGLTTGFIATGTYDIIPDQDITGLVTWTSANPAFASHQGGGFFRGETAGIGQVVGITASLDGKTSNSAQLTVTAAVVDHITVTPATAQIYTSAPMNTQNFSAVATYSNGTTVNVTTTADWTVNPTGVATIGLHTGLATAVAAGATTVTATFGGKSDTAALTVVDPTLQTIVVTGPPIVKLGLTGNYAATGHYNNGSTQVLTNVVAWSTNNTGLLTIDNTGLATATLVEGPVQIIAQYQGITGTLDVETKDKILVSIAIEPASRSVAAGRQTQAFVATGTYDTQATLDITNLATWTSADPTKVSSMGNGVFKGETPGIGQTVTVTATLETISQTAQVMVTPAVLTSITVSPANQTVALGESVQYSATGGFSDGTSAPITGVTWTSMDTTKADIGATTGLATTKPNKNTGIVTINATKTASDLVEITGTTTLTINAPRLLSISVTPANPTIYTKGNGSTVNLTATGTYTDDTLKDITTNSTWSSSLTTVANIGLNTGKVTTTNTLGKKGAPTMTATFGGLTGSTKVTVIDPGLTSLAVTAAGDITSIKIGGTNQLTATGTFNNGLVEAITNTVDWSSNTPSVVTVSTGGAARGLVTGQTPGTATITASTTNLNNNQTISGTISITVQDPAITVLAITPANPTMFAGAAPIQLTAVATYDDGSIRDVTGSALWSSGNTAVANVTASGLVNPSVSNGGTSVITANVSGNLATTTVTVRIATVASIQVTAAQSPIAAGTSTTFTATANLSDGTLNVDVTKEVTWTSTNTSVAVVKAGGEVQSLAVGTATIVATKGLVSGSANLTVGPHTLTSITVAPTNPVDTLISGTAQTRQFTATGVYTDGLLQDMTNTVAWTSSTGAATINAGTGLATLVAAGTTTITATGGGKSGSAILTINPDRTPPTIGVITPSNGMNTNLPTMTIKANVGDATSARVTVNGVDQIAPVAGGAINLPVNLKVGRNNIVVYASDGTNEGSSGTIEVNMKALTPVITIDTLPTRTANTMITANGIGAITGTAANLSASGATLYLNGVATAIKIYNGNYSVNLTTSLKEGDNTIAFTGYDATNTNMGTSGVRKITLDTTAPTIAVASPNNNSVVNTMGVTVNGTLSDATVTKTTITVAGGSSYNATVSGGIFSADVVLPNQGLNIITVSGTDDLGNACINKVVNVTFDATRPAIAITSPQNNVLTNNGGILLQGTVNDPDILKADLYIGGVKQADQLTVYNGTFKKTLTLANGANSFEVRAKDAANNEGSSGVVTVNLDVTPPTLTIVLSDPTDVLKITVKSNEPLKGIPVLSGVTNAIMTSVSDREFIADFANPPSGNQPVIASGTDLANNMATATARYIKQTIPAIVPGTPAVVQTETAKVEISSTANLTNQTITVTTHTGNVAENDEAIDADDHDLGIFLDIVASGNLTDSIDEIYIEIPYDPAQIAAMGLDEEDLEIYTFDEDTGSWVMETNYGVNTVENFVWVIITHLSKFGMFASEGDAPPPPPATGGGGVASTAIDLTDSGLSSDITLRITSTGRVLSTTNMATSDGKVSYKLTVNTLVLDADGQPVYTGFGAVEVANPPTSPEGTGIVSAYNMLPDGVTFNPAITLTMTYDPATLPEGMDESELYIAWWDGTVWVALESVVDTVANVITAQVTHFTQFAVIGQIAETQQPGEGTTDTGGTTTPETPASFEVSDLTISSTSVEAGDMVTIKVLVSNSGDLSGTYTVILNLNGVPVESRDVTLAGGTSQTVTFTTTGDAAGQYTVSVGDLSGSYTVTEPVVIEPDDTEPDDTGETAEPTPAGGIPGWAWALIIIAIVGVLGGAGYWWYRRRLA